MRIAALLLVANIAVFITGIGVDGSDAGRAVNGSPQCLRLG
jgi:hypothetical protein